MPASQAEPGPAFLPRILSAALLLLGFVTLVAGIRSKRTEGDRTGETVTLPGPELQPESEPGLDPDIDRVWAAVGVTFMYVWLFEPLGFVLSTLAYTFGVTVLFRRDHSKLLFVVPLLCTLAIYLFFRVGLGARLPVGPFG